MPRTSILHRSVQFLFCLALPVIIGLLASKATMPNIPTWYADLVKPPLTPPNGVFAPAWSTLYILMGVSSYLIWRSATSPARSQALLAYGLQLFLNMMWSFSFFSMHSPALGLFNIVLLWASILVMLYTFSRVNRTAALLQIPNLLWVSFAFYLNTGILILNS